MLGRAAGSSEHLLFRNLRLAARAAPTQAPSPGGDALQLA
jgi:hypothetical protein